MPPSIMCIWMLAGVLGAAGVALLLMAWGVSARGLRADPPRIGELGGRCRGCGYCTDGLESERCPECGRTFVAAAHALTRRRRAIVAMLGAGAVTGAAVCVPMAEAARFGWANSAPSWVLVMVAKWSPEALPAMSGSLRVRAQAGMLNAAERRTVAALCEEIIGHTRECTLRREAAWVLGTVGDGATDACIMRLLQDRDAVLRAEGVRAAMGGRYGPRMASAWVVKRLLTLAASDRSVLVRKMAVDTVRTVGAGEEARLALGRALHDENDGVRRRALMGLTVEAPAEWESLWAAVSAAADADEGTRQLAAWALGRMSGGKGMRPRAVEAMAGVLPLLATMAIGDEDEGVRYAAWDALRTIRG